MNVWQHQQMLLPRSLHRLWCGRSLSPSVLAIAKSAAIRHKSTASASEKNQSLTIFSGIQPTGVPHLGNYLGALRQWVQLQNKATSDTTLLFSVVDLHAITVKQDRDQLRRWRREMLASLLAVGLDPKRSIIFYQSSVPQHSELHWILSCNASMGYLSRMTQWKSKLSLPENASPIDPSTKTKLKLGLFSYPVLQAADVLVHRATHVPVGEDQSQHLELCREVALSFNHHHSCPSLLTPPTTILAPAKRVMSLTQPTKKMSKSDADPKSRILITDSYDVIKRKIKSALTDSIEGVSYETERRPGVSNLVELMWHLDPQGTKSPVELASGLKGLSLRALKERVAEAVEAEVSGVRERYRGLVDGNGWGLEVTAEDGGRRARKRAEETMEEVRKAVGLV